MEAFFARERESAGKRVAGLCGDVARREAFVADLAAQAKAR
jgi:hypothetical protein